MEEKSKQLGMNASTASARLVKDLLYKLVVETGRNGCYRCGKPMSRGTFSIEHKTPWLHSDDPVRLYFDTENISFSHLSCNVGAARRKEAVCGTRSKYMTGCRCAPCTESERLHSAKRYTPERRKQIYQRTGK